MTMRSGLTLIETVVSVAVVSVLFAAAMNTTGIAAATRALASDRRTAEKLCQELMAEVLSTTYYDPDTGLNGDGPAGHEASATDRLLLDDVDDFNGWKSTPPINRDGSAIPGTSGLTRGVRVTKFTGSGDTDLFRYAGEVKIVVVQVLRGSKVLATLTEVRAPAWDKREREE